MLHYVEAAPRRSGRILQIPLILVRICSKLPSAYIAASWCRSFLIVRNVPSVCTDEALNLGFTALLISIAGVLIISLNSLRLIRFQLEKGLTFCVFTTIIVNDRVLELCIWRGIKSLHSEVVALLWPVGPAC